MARKKLPIKKYPCMILCAGTSKRFGSNKMLADLAGRPLLAHTIDRMRPQVSELSLNGEGGEYDGFGLPVFADVIAGKLGPLAGILTAMEWAAGLGNTHVLTVSGDTPFMPEDLAKKLGEAIMSAAPVLPSVGAQKHQICGLWPVTSAQKLRLFLRVGKSYKVRDYIALYETRMVRFEKENGIDPFFNINTREDMKIAEKILAQIVGT